MSNIVDITLKFGRSDLFTLVWTGDWHIGSRNHKKEGVEAVKDRAHNKAHGVILGGDLMDAIAPTDIRFDVSEVADADMATISVKGQTEACVQHQKDLADVCFGAIMSNHEGKLSKLLGNWTEFMCGLSGVPFLGQVVPVRAHCPHGVIKILLTHYLPSMRSQLDDPLRSHVYRMGRLRRVLNPFEADLKLGAHIHRFLVTPPVNQKRMVIDGQGQEWKRRPTNVYRAWHVVSPSMMTAYDHPGYGQARLTEPTDIGWAEIDITRNGKVVEVRHVLPDGTVENKQTGEILVD